MLADLYFLCAFLQRVSVNIQDKGIGVLIEYLFYLGISEVSIFDKS